DGKATATLVSNTPGNGNVSVTLTEQVLKTDSRTLTFAQNATLRLEPNQLTAKADGADEVTFTFTATDTANKPLANRTVIWANRNNLGDMKGEEKTTNANGQATAKLTSFDVGKAKLAVTLKNKDGSSYSETLSPEVDFTLSAKATLTPDINQQLADGREVINLKLVATDASNNRVRNTPISWAATNGVTFVTKPAETDDNGEATVSVSSIQAVSTVVTATLENAGAHADSTAVVFKKATLSTVADPDTIYTSYPPITNDASTITLIAKNVDGSPLVGYTVDWKNNGVGTMTIIDSITNKDGKATATLTSSEAGTTTITANLKNPDSSVHDGSVSNEIEILETPVQPPAETKVVIAPDHNQVWADGSRTITIKLTDVDDLPIEGKELILDFLSEKPVTDKNGEAKVQFSNSVPGKHTLTVHPEGDAENTASTTIEVLSIPVLEWRIKDAAAWHQNDWTGKPLLKNGELELQVTNAEGNVTWTPSSGISVSGNNSNAVATLVSPVARMTVDYEVFSNEPLMRRKQTFTLNGTPILRPNDQGLLTYDGAIDACLAIGATQVDEAIAQSVFNTWGSILRFGYGKVFDTWLNGSLGEADPKLPNRAKALDMNEGFIITAYDSTGASSRGLCAK
ncbi:Ig-like domain-containing protein, partial [Ewingella americana]|uniref:Ig-like domain-containing protein n=1 Tax=Ewingella americana TaxID=41202 RepID=UPI0012ADC62B